MEVSDLFSTNFQRPEEDEFLLRIVEQFDGSIIAIRNAQDGGPNVWIETVRPRAVRPHRSALTHLGKPVAERLTEPLKLGQYGGYGKDKPRGKITPWRLVWSGDREPLNVGLFDSEEHAMDFRRYGR